MKWNKTKNKKEIKFKLYRFYFFLIFLFTIFFERFFEELEVEHLPPEEVPAGIGGTNIFSLSPCSHELTLPINASWSDNVARNVESISISVSDNSSAKAIAKVDDNTK